MRCIQAARVHEPRLTGPTLARISQLIEISEASIIPRRRTIMHDKKLNFIEVKARLQAESNTHAYIILNMVFNSLQL